MAYNVFITRRIPAVGVDMLRAQGYVVDMSTKNRPLTHRELLRALRKKPYHAVLSLLTDTVDAEILTASPATKVFANYAVGFNNFDVVEAQKRNVYLTNTPGGGAETVAEHVFGLILALGRHIVESNDFIKKGKYTGWDPLLFPGIELKGKTLGIIGAGKIGCDVAYIARGFGMNVSYYDVARNDKIEKECGAVFEPAVENVLRMADIVSLHVPLLDSTHHLIDEQKLSLMKPSALLISTSRGAVVDEQALTDALIQKKIAGAGLDVFEYEPKVNRVLLKLTNVVLTPHIASSTRESRETMATMAAQNIIAVLEGGKPINPVL